MKKRIAQWLVSVAKWLYPCKEFERADRYHPRKLGVSYSIDKNMFRKYMKGHPGYSRREAMAAIVEHTKKEIAGSIFSGIYKNELIEFEVKTSMFTADIAGTLYVYGSKEEEE